jgi:hypothetical protein
MKLSFCALTKLHSGKTYVAKKLAKIIGIDYAMMSGGDVSPLGSDAVIQIHQLFSWAAKSPKGVILFIDEAECFLGSNNEALNSVSRCTESLVYTYPQCYLHNGVIKEADVGYK